MPQQRRRPRADLPGTDCLKPERTHLPRHSGRSLPSFEEWLTLDNRARLLILDEFPYDEAARPLIQRVADDFREKYRHLDIVVRGVGSYHGGSWVISVQHDFIFDRRLLPSMHLGVWVHTSNTSTPEEFSGPYIWSPPNYERFVDRHTGQIRRKLGAPQMSRQEMLSALVGRPWEQFVESCRESVRKGQIPPFESF